MVPLSMYFEDWCYTQSDGQRISSYSLFQTLTLFAYKALTVNPSDYVSGNESSETLTQIRSKAIDLRLIKS